MVELKVCTKCKIPKPLSEYGTHKGQKSGKNPACKECKRLAGKKFYQENREQVKKTHDDYYERTKEVRKEKHAAYRVVNREKINSYHRRLYWEKKVAIRQKHTEYWEANRESLKSKGREYRNRLALFEPYGSKVPPDAKPSLSGDGITLLVICKSCGRPFSPTNSQVIQRIRSFEGKTKGENNFYCSEQCREVCPIFHAKETPRSLRSRSKKIRSCQTSHLKQLQCDEHGHNFCERCGDIIDVELHHTLPVAEYGTDAVNSSGHILVCFRCHTELQAQCG